MSDFKFIDKPNRPLINAIQYITDPLKTCDDLIVGIGLSSKYACTEMQMAAVLWYRDGQAPPYLYAVLSFDAGVQDTIPMGTIKNIVSHVGQLFPANHQVLAAIHTDTTNLHAHFLINKINVANGKIFRHPKSLFTYKQEINSILEAYDIPPIYCFTGEELVVQTDVVKSDAVFQQA